MQPPSIVFCIDIPKKEWILEMINAGQHELHCYMFYNIHIGTVVGAENIFSTGAVSLVLVHDMAAGTHRTSSHVPSPVLSAAAPAIPVQNVQVTPFYFSAPLISTETDLFKRKRLQCKNICHLQFQSFSNLLTSQEPKARI
ncbi:hypothetical protein CEXT_511231 [Caerostris extrusa]|uniref:Uncharacterized protein n=1 Tax=Caerostris extrusa TaxID=172846 RepID=A0AAV4VFS5_CAEEX|nr:hypothetical protein CEXT_511231 [Caerostris extrusa]